MYLSPLILDVYNPYLHHITTYTVYEARTLKSRDLASRRGSNVLCHQTSWGFEAYVLSEYVKTADVVTSRIYINNQINSYFQEAAAVSSTTSTTPLPISSGNNAIA